MSKKSEKGLELTDRSWATALLWFDIETLARDGSYEPESHYQAIIMGKPLAEYRNMTDEEMVTKLRSYLDDETQLHAVIQNGLKFGKKYTQEYYAERFVEETSNYLKSVRNE